jgi:hypothetical protein
LIPLDGGLVILAGEEENTGMGIECGAVMGLMVGEVAIFIGNYPDAGWLHFFNDVGGHHHLGGKGADSYLAP